MKNKVLKVAIIMLVIVAMTMSDFILFGMNIAYALESINDTTNHDNVKFAAYFKTEDGKAVSSKKSKIDKNDMKLYLEVAVEKQGYFEGVITLQESNFKLKQDILSKGISKIEGNTITLNRVGAGDSVEIVVGIEPIIEENYGEKMLSKESVLKLAGKYNDSTEKTINIESEKNVILSLLAPTNLETTFEAKVITNSIYPIKEENKRIVQIELNSGVVENAYPIKTTTFELTLPEGVESIEAISKGTYATNGQADMNLKENLEIDTKNNTVKLLIKNQAKDGKISWKEDAEDSIVLTLILDKEAKINEQEYTAKAKVEFYGQEAKWKEKEVTYKLDQEANADGIITTSIENKDEIYKGKLYSGETREYKTTTNIEVNYAGLAPKTILEEKTFYRTETEEKQANIQYKSTTISKAEFDKVLGEEGKLVIKGQDKNEIATITKETKTDENENITIDYSGNVKGLIIEITNTVATGIIRLNHTKTIKEEATRKEIITLKNLVEEATVTYNNAENKTELNKSLGETKTVAELTDAPQTLSTATINEQVKFAVTLKTDSEQYDLYKNPTITIKLPEEVRNVTNIKAVPLYLDNFETSANYNAETKEIKLTLKGEQTKYNGSDTNGYIEILADIELDEIMPNKQSTITLTYANEKAISYQNEGKFQLAVNISGHSGLVAFNKITNYNIKTNSASTKEEQIGNLKMYRDAAEANFQIVLVNNVGEKLEKVELIGNLPTNGKITLGDYTFENTVGATLKSGLNIQNGEADIYYTANANASTDLGKAQNGWSKNIAEVENPVLYMIVISNMEKQTNFIANYTMNIPANLEYSKDLRTAYIASYEGETVTGSVKAIPVGLETGKVSLSLGATVGTDILEQDGVVKSGEKIKYQITATNTGSNDVNNVKLSGLVPEGTVYVELVEEWGEVYSEETEQESAGAYYKEDETKKTAEYTLETLKSGESKTFTYEVMVKNDLIADSITNQATIVYNEDVETKSNILTNKLEAGEIKVTVERRTTALTTLIPQATVQYFVTVENLSDIAKNNIDLKINEPEEFERIGIAKVSNSSDTYDETENGIKISSIPAKSKEVYLVYYVLKEVAELSKEVSISAITTCENKTYRSNEYNENLFGFDVQIDMSATREGEYLKPGDTIEYTITVTNNSEIATANHAVEMELAEQLTMQKLEVDGENRQIHAENYMNIALNIESKKASTIKVTAIVNYDLTRTEIEKISTVAELLYIGGLKDTTEPITHYLEAIVEPDIPVDDPTDDPTDNPSDDPADDPIDNPDKPKEKLYNISGKAWLDQDKDGKMNNDDTILKGIKVKLLDTETNKFVRNSEGTKDLVIETSENGDYIFENIIEGSYVVVFEYDNTLYKPTTYKKQGIEESKNSDVLAKVLTINREGKDYGATDKIELNQNITNINMGLVFIKQFDIKLDKYISKIIVQTSKDTVTYDYDHEDFAKVEVQASRIVGSTMLVQYTIRLENIGDVDAYVNTVVDYIPEGLEFSSELNTNWYEMNGNLYTNSLANTAIKNGEVKELTLILTKTKTNGDAELINNMAEIHEAYNIYGIADLNSKQANQNVNENDLGSADLLISIQTGTVFNYMALVISMLAIIGVAAYLINKKVLRIKL